MGFKNKQSGKYFTILGGKFCIRVEEGTEGAKMRVNKVGKTVYEVFHDSFEGKLLDVKTTESKDYGKSWVFVFTDGSENYNLQLSFSNSMASSFLKMLPNVDLTKNIEMTPVAKEVDGKTKNSLFLKQDGVNIKHAYTMENQNGLPNMEQKMVKGKKVWDDTLRLEFFEEMVRTQILPKLPGSNAVSESPSTEEEAVDTVEGEEDDF